MLSNLKRIITGIELTDNEEVTAPKSRPILNQNTNRVTKVVLTNDWTVNISIESPPMTIKLNNQIESCKIQQH